MANKEGLSIYLEDLIALCYIIYYYKSNNSQFNLSAFNVDYYNVIEETNNFYHNKTGSYYNVEKMLDYNLPFFKHYYCPGAIKNFYQKHELAINIIKRYSNLNGFIDFNKTVLDNPLNFFYKYILDNEQELSKIIAVVDKIYKLGIQKLFFKQNDDFNDNEYEIATDDDFYRLFRFDIHTLIIWN